LLAASAQPLRKKLVTLVFDDPAVYAWGGETVSIGGDAVGELSSVGWGWAAGRCVALGYVRGAAAAVSHAGTPVTVDLWGLAVGARAWDRWGAQAR
jgi:4-methylaminobutanoate oxidase (formaldehyde-forming)